MAHHSLLTQIFIHIGIIQQTNYTCSFYRLYSVCCPTVREIKEVWLAKKLVTIYNSHFFNHSLDAKEFSLNISQSYSYPHMTLESLHHLHHMPLMPIIFAIGISYIKCTSFYYTHKSNRNMVHTFAWQDMYFSSPLQSTTTFYQNFSWDICFPCIQFPIILIPLA